MAGDQIGIVVASNQHPGSRCTSPGSRCTSAVGRARVLNIFRHFDRRGDGMFSCPDLAIIIKELDRGGTMTDKDINDLLDAIDVDGEGAIHYEVFCEWIFRPPESQQSLQTLAAAKSSQEGVASRDNSLANSRAIVAEHLQQDLLLTHGSSWGGLSSEANDEDEDALDLDLPLPDSGNTSPMLFMASACHRNLARELSAWRDKASGELSQVPETPGAASQVYASSKSSNCTPLALSKIISGSGTQFSERTAAPMLSERTLGPQSERTAIPENSAGSRTVDATPRPSMLYAGPFAPDGTVALVSLAHDANAQFRPYMEDGHKVVDPITLHSSGNDEHWGFFAVYDGHGGRHEVDFCESFLHQVLATESQNLAGNFDVPVAMRRCFEKIDSQLSMKGAWKSGCTATVALVHRAGSQLTLHVANVGDSRAVVVGSSGSRRVTTDHLAIDHEEAARVVRAGGIVRHGRVGGQLSVSRSLGDHHLKSSGVSCKPEVSSNDIRGDRALVIASDGLWDALEDADACNTVNQCMARADALGGDREAFTKYLCDNAAKDLVELAKRNGSRDNILVLVMFF